MVEHKGCNCSECTEDCSADYDLNFACCKKCGRRVAVLENVANVKNLKCCGEVMTSLTDMPSTLNKVFECPECKARILVAEDAICTADVSGASFTCCGVPMKEIEDRNDSEDLDEIEDGDYGYLYCENCKSLVSVLVPCECGDDCGVHCCGKKMYDMDSMVAHVSEMFICSKCGSKVIIEEEDLVSSEDLYKPIECCGQPMTYHPGEIEMTDEMADKEYNTALYCKQCERVVLTDGSNSGKISCCGTPMPDLSTLSDFAGELFECKKCGMKIIIEEAGRSDQSDGPAPFICCDQPMVLQDF